VLTGRDIVLIASIDWEPLWQSHHEVATRLADAGNRVLFVENTGIRMPTVSDTSRVAKRVHRWTRSVREPGQVRPNLWVYAPAVLPPFEPPGIRRLNRALFLPAISRVARRLGFVDPIIWTWLPTDTAVDLSRQLRGPRSVLIYFDIADFSSLARRSASLAASEVELLRECDLVLAYDEASQRRAQQFAQRVERVPPLVNLTRFSLAPVRARLPDRPLIGYIGGLHRFLDLQLIAESARSRPQWDWRLIGPHQTDLSQLAGLSNVRLDGARDHSELPALVAQFDVGVVPYRVAADTRSLAPTKINEYLAAGKPVAAIELPWVKEFQARHHVLEVSPASVELFITACERALRSSVDPAAAKRRRQVAAESAWETRLESISAIVEEIVREKEVRDP